MKREPRPAARCRALICLELPRVELGEPVSQTNSAPCHSPRVIHSGFAGFVLASLATLFGLAPQTFAFVYLGSVGRLAVDGSSMPALKVVLMIAGALTSAIIVWLVGRRARASLATRLDQQ